MVTLDLVREHFGVTDLNVSGPTMTNAGRKEFCALLQRLGCRRGAEIGVWTGEFAQTLCESVPLDHLFCVDPWTPYADYLDPKNKPGNIERAYGKALKRLKRLPVTMLRMLSVDGAKQVPDGSLDFVYIDGNHGAEYVRQDIEAWMPKIRSGGIMSGHDYEWRKKHLHLQVKAAVDAYVEAHRISPLFILPKDKSPSWLWVKA